MLRKAAPAHRTAGDLPGHLPGRFDEPMPLVRLIPNGTTANRDARCRMVVVVHCR